MSRSALPGQALGGTGQSYGDNLAAARERGAAARAAQPGEAAKSASLYCAAYCAAPAIPAQPDAAGNRMVGTYFQKRTSAARMINPHTVHFFAD